MTALDTLDNLFTSEMIAKSKSTLAYVKLRSSNIAVSGTIKNIQEVRNPELVLLRRSIATFIDDWPN